MVKEIPLTQGKVTLVDDEDYPLISQYKWYAHNADGYWSVITNVQIKNGKRMSLRIHRVILNPEEDKEVDHINGDGLDNRRCNIRIVTKSQNLMNSRKQPRRCSSNYKGVMWHKYTKKWMAQIRFNKKRTYLGVFTNEIEAARAYDLKAKELFGEYAKLNFENTDNKIDSN